VIYFCTFRLSVAALTWRAGINFKFWPNRTFRIKSFPGHFTAAVATAMKWRPTTGNKQIALKQVQLHSKQEYVTQNFCGGLIRNPTVGAKYFNVTYCA